MWCLLCFWIGCHCWCLIQQPIQGWKQKWLPPPQALPCFRHFLHIHVMQCHHNHKASHQKWMWLHNINFLIGIFMGKQTENLDPLKWSNCHSKNAIEFAGKRVWCANYVLLKERAFLGQFGSNVSFWCDIIPTSWFDKICRWHGWQTSEMAIVACVVCHLCQMRILNHATFDFPCCFMCGFCCSQMLLCFDIFRRTNKTRHLLACHSPGFL